MGKRKKRSSRNDKSRGKQSAPLRQAQDSDPDRLDDSPSAEEALIEIEQTSTETPAPGALFCEPQPDEPDAQTLLEPEPTEPEPTEPEPVEPEPPEPEPTEPEAIEPEPPEPEPLEPTPNTLALALQGLGERVRGGYFSLANRVYRKFYYIGVQVLRLTRTRRRHITIRIRRLEETSARRSVAARRGFALWVRARWRALTAPARELRGRCSDFIREVTAARRYGAPGKVFGAFARMAGYLLGKLWKIFRTLLNYALPVAACMLLVWTIQQFRQEQYVLSVTYNGEQVGYIENEAIFTKAETAMRERLILGDVLVADPTTQLEDLAEEAEEATSTDDEPADTDTDDTNDADTSEPEPAPEPAPEPEPEPVEALPIPVTMQLVRLDVGKGQHLTDVDSLTDALIRAASKDAADPNSLTIAQADGLYINDAYVGAVTDGQRLLIEMNEMLDRFTPSDLAENATVQFVKKVQIKRGLYPVASLRPLEDVLTLLRKEERGKKIYTVVSGDTPIRIAAKNGIPFEELKQLNPDVDIRLFPGDELLISQSVPYLGVQVTETIRYEEEMDFQIKQEVDPEMDIGYTRIKQEGRMGLRVVTAEIKKIDGVETERIITDRTVLEQPVERILVVGGNQPLKFLPKSSADSGVQKGAFIWPADGGYISMPIWGYPGHTGTDIAGRIGLGVRASADGVVVVAKYSGYGYGNYIVIEHGGGVQTVYAHNSKLMVSVGTPVKQGELIALMGQTGNASGPHVHFEIRSNGQYLDARNYF